MSHGKRRGRPRILLVADRPNWALDRQVRGLKDLLEAEFDFGVMYVEERPLALKRSYDLLHVFFWGETYHQQWRPSPHRVIKAVHSHRWEFDPHWAVSGPAEFVTRHLTDSETVEVSSPRLEAALGPHKRRLRHIRQPIRVGHTEIPGPPSGRLKVGWAGNPEDREKQFDKFFPAGLPASVEFVTATGQFSPEQMPAFYAGLDVLCVTSRSEGTPQPLLDALASGCFVVATDVGLVPELIEDGFNGRIIDSDPAELRRALERCRAELCGIRTRRREIAARLRGQWSDDELRNGWRRFYNDALAHAEVAGSALVGPGAAVSEERRVAERFQVPVRERLRLDPMQPRIGPLEKILAAGVKAGSTVVVSTWMSLDGVPATVGQCGSAGTTISAVYQPFGHRLLRRGLHGVARVMSAIGMRRLGRRVRAVPTQYIVALKSLHSDC